MKLPEKLPILENMEEKDKVLDKYVTIHLYNTLANSLNEILDYLKEEREG